METTIARVDSRLTRKRVVLALAALLLALLLSLTAAAAPADDAVTNVQTDNSAPPTETVKLIFIHHSCGENWLDDGNGGLGITLSDSNYFVSDTNYGWGPDSIGDNTDIGHWWTWFRGPLSATYLSDLYAESDQHSSYSRQPTDPGGENEIVMFKSCYPNSNLRGNPAENPPAIGSNPLRGQSCGSPHHTVANAKSIYNDLLHYFASRQDKLFVVITAPPVQNATYASNARALNTWLVEDWLDAYPHNNVAVFDFYNVLTSNGGNWYTNDLVWATGNHHRHHNGAIEYITDQGTDTAAYPNDGSDNHPSPAGNQKASSEFVPLLNTFYNRWKEGEETPTATPTGAPPTATPTHTPTPTHSHTHTATPTPSGTGEPSPTPTLTETPALAYRIYLPLILKGWSSPPSTPTPTATVPPPPGDLIQPSDLTYLGAFRLPDVPGPDECSWKWSNWGSALTYYPDGDPNGPSDSYPGSLFGTGHDWNQWVSEVSIPVPVISPARNLNDLHTASTIQPFRDIRDGLFGELELPRVGLAHLPPQGAQTTGKLYFAWAEHAPGQPDDTGPSHGWAELDLAHPQPGGPWRMGGYPKYVTGDYLFPIPNAWADDYASGQYLATGRFRDGGQGTEGPSLFAIGPWNEGNLPPSGATIPATPLLLYENVSQESPHSLNNYHHSDEWSGGAWLTAGNKSAAIFVGSKGTGKCWYGCPDGTVWPDEPPYPSDCPERGWWSTGFEGQIIFYAPADLAAVARGEMETWQPQPYATLNIDEYLYHLESSQQKHHLGAASFDRERGLLYVFEPLADGDKPLIHAWRTG